MDGSTLSAKDKGAGEASPAAEAVGEHHVLTREELIAKVRAYHPRVKLQGIYKDYDQPLMRVAISLGRYVQDPMAETLQLWHEMPDENSLLRLDLHRLQGAVRPQRLHHL
ncbi:MAG: hypothetical protein CME96_14735, partial [Hyphomonas sp.]|nr:hypothetical protein [Hyphomonas sp.]